MALLAVHERYLPALDPRRVEPLRLRQSLAHRHGFQFGWRRPLRNASLALILLLGMVAHHHRRDFLAARPIDGSHLREEPPFRAGDVHRRQPLAENGRLRTRFTSGDIDRQHDSRRCGRGGIRAAGHRHSMHAHVLEDQVAKFLGAIAGELAGHHELAGQRPRKARRMRDLDRDPFLSTGVTAHDEKSYGNGQTSNHGIASSRRAAGADLLSIRSTDHAPDPAIMIAAVIASTST